MVLFIPAAGSPERKYYVGDCTRQPDGMRVRNDNNLHSAGPDLHGSTN
jgi:hypothetical protein